jgi:predicted rRNA methylase YqxC with S4 and FtsJ domains
MGKMPIEKLLVERGACPSMSMARRHVHQGIVKENGRVIEPGEEVEENADLTLGKKEI